MPKDKYVVELIVETDDSGLTHVSIGRVREYTDRVLLEPDTEEEE
ncbi:hypothetical protein LCGC14_0620080 [marine sediment metagenome]|uniref:Uncharacterized protein n=1 Tax=marine sediment metagenome TaxID=412755 RepID=A0A0F9TRI7_9ZZZZ